MRQDFWSFSSFFLYKIFAIFETIICDKWQGRQTFFSFGFIRNTFYFSLLFTCFRSFVCQFKRILKCAYFLETSYLACDTFMMLLRGSVKAPFCFCSLYARITSKSSLQCSSLFRFLFCWFYQKNVCSTLKFLKAQYNSFIL